MIERYRFELSKITEEFEVSEIFNTNGENIGMGVKGRSPSRDGSLRDAGVEVFGLYMDAAGESLCSEIELVPGESKNITE